MIIIKGKEHPKNFPGKRNTLLFTGSKKLAPSRISRPSKLANCPVQKYARFRFCDVGLMLENIFRSSDVINYVGYCQMFWFVRKPQHSICTTGLCALSSVVWYRKKRSQAETTAVVISGKMNSQQCPGLTDNRLSKKLRQVTLSTGPSLTFKKQLLT